MDEHLMWFFMIFGAIIGAVFAYACSFFFGEARQQYKKGHEDGRVMGRLETEEKLDVCYMKAEPYETESGNRYDLNRLWSDE